MLTVRQRRGFITSVLPNLVCKCTSLSNLHREKPRAHAYGMLMVKYKIQHLRQDGQDYPEVACDFSVRVVGLGCAEHLQRR